MTAFATQPVPAHEARRFPQIVVMTSGAFNEAYVRLAQDFAATTGSTFLTTATKLGAGLNSIPNRLAAGEQVDVVIVASTVLERLTADGLVRTGTKVDLAQSSIAMAVRAGSPAPDIRTVDALKDALKKAKSIACSRSVSGEYLMGELFPRLGIAEEMQTKTRLADGESVAAVIARGDAEIGFQQVSELQGAEGIEIVDLLPPGAQKVTTFCGAVGSAACSPEAAWQFLSFLRSSKAWGVIEEAGLQPIR